MSVTNLFELNALVYIAGVSMPYTSISVQTSFSAIPRCTIALPPDSRLYGIGRYDRVPVHVFIKNTFVDDEDQAYFLFFEGEVEGFGYVSNAISREFVINARSAMGFLNDVRFSYLADGQDYARALVPGQTLTTALITGHAKFAMPLSLFMQGSAPGPAEVGESNVITYPTRVLENTAAFLHGESEKFTYPTPVSAYFKGLVESLRFRDRVFKVPYFDDGGGFPLLHGLQKATQVTFLSKMAGESPNSDSAWGLIDYVVRNMEYELAVYNAPNSSGGNPISVCMKPMLYDAVPPRCNILFRSMVGSVRANETVHGLLTRIRTRDEHGPMAVMSKADTSVLREIAIVDYWPNNHSKEEYTASDDGRNRVALELLDTEAHGGPVLTDVDAPPWMGYVSTKENEETAISFADRIREHLYRLKTYEPRALVVDSAFNPFVVPGYPGVVYDSDEGVGSGGFTFIGQVLTVTHTFSKDSASTSVEMSFVRTLEDQLRDPIKNSIPEISTRITHRGTEMGEIYEHLLGCGALPFKDLETLKHLPEQEDPLLAYRFNRRSIITLPEYLNFMSFTIEAGGALMEGGVGGKDFFTSRYKPYPEHDLRKLLLEVVRDATGETIVYA